MKYLIIVLIMLSCFLPKQVMGAGESGRYWKADDPWIGSFNSRIKDTPTGIEISSHATVDGALKAASIETVGNAVIGGDIDITGSLDASEATIKGLSIFDRIEATQATVGTLQFNKALIPSKFITCDVFTSDGINACIDALGVEGGEVYLPEGTYAIDGTITIDYNNTTLRGAGWGTILDASAWSTGHVIDLNGCDYLIFKDFKIIGNAGGGNAKDLIADGSVATTDSLFENLYLLDSDRHGMSIFSNSSVRNRIINCIFDNSDDRGYYGLAQYTLVTNNIAINCVYGFNTGGNYSIFRNNYAASNNDNFRLGGSWNTISGNISYAASWVGMVLTGSENTISGNTVHSSTQHGIYIEGHRNTIRGNVILNSTSNYNSIALSGATYNIITNNYCGGLGAAYVERGIYLANSDYNIISENTTRLHATCGIGLDANSDNNQITYNNLEGEAVAKIIDVGTNNLIVHAIGKKVGINTVWPRAALHVATGALVKGTLETGILKATGSLVGNISAGNYTETESDGTLEFNGEATVWNDLFMPFSHARVPATNNPAWTSFVGNLNEFTFADGDLLEGTTEVMHDYKEGSDIEPHIHWATQSSDATVRGVKWELEYSIANINYPLFVGDVFPNPTVIATETTVRANLPAKTHIHTSWGDVVMAGAEIGAHIAYRVRRITATGTAPASNPYGLGLGIHYEINTVGSRTPFNK